MHPDRGLGWAPVETGVRLVSSLEM